MPRLADERYPGAEVYKESPAGMEFAWLTARQNAQCF